MAGLLKPQAAYRLISELKDTVDLPIHLHTHDTSGNGIITYSGATQAGVDIIDVATASLAGGTSQPSMQSIYYALEHGPRHASINVKMLNKLTIIGKMFVNIMHHLKRVLQVLRQKFTCMKCLVVNTLT